MDTFTQTRNTNFKTGAYRETFKKTNGKHGKYFAQDWIFVFEMHIFQISEPI